MKPCEPRVQPNISTSLTAHNISLLNIGTGMDMMIANVLARL